MHLTKATQDNDVGLGVYSLVSQMHRRGQDPPWL